jgi:hypothetical protein
MVKNALGAAAALALTVFSAAPAQAAAVLTFSGNSAGSTGNFLQTTFVDPTTSTQIKVQATAWSIDSGGTIRSSALGKWSGGLGVINPGNDGQHTIDNSGWTDFVLFQFDTPVELDNIWVTAFGDTDAYVRSGNGANIAWNAPTSANPLKNANASTLATLMPNYVAVPGDDTSGIRAIANSGASNWWMVSASNIIDYVESCSGKGRKRSCVNEPVYDSFKLKGLEVSQAGAVPEPATWLMMITGIGFAGAAVRRRNKVSLRSGQSLA